MTVGGIEPSAESSGHFMCRNGAQQCVGWSGQALSTEVVMASYIVFEPVGSRETIVLGFGHF